MCESRVRPLSGKQSCLCLFMSWISMSGKAPYKKHHQINLILLLLKKTRWSYDHSRKDCNKARLLKYSKDIYLQWCFVSWMLMTNCSWYPITEQIMVSRFTTAKCLPISNRMGLVILIILYINVIIIRISVAQFL